MPPDKQRGRPAAGDLSKQKQNAAGDGFTSSVTVAADVDAIPEPVPCHYVGIYCTALALLRLEEVGRLDLCCRHFLDDEVA